MVIPASHLLRIVDACRAPRADIIRKRLDHARLPGSRIHRRDEGDYSGDGCRPWKCCGTSRLAPDAKGFQTLLTALLRFIERTVVNGNSALDINPGASCRGRRTRTTRQSVPAVKEKIGHQIVLLAERNRTDFCLPDTDIGFEIEVRCRAWDALTTIHRELGIRLIA
jgi:hypothetical protein